MIKIFSGKNTNTLYKEVLTSVWNEGSKVSPRGLKTRELSPAITIINKPLERVQTQYGRGGNIFFLVAEILWILKGRGDGVFIEYYNKQIMQFKDEGFINFNGAYGTRIRRYGIDRDESVLHEPIDQLKTTYEKLKEDRDTRQACFSLWHPNFDAERESKDHPCNNMSYFKIRDGKLNLHQILRSNDVTFGLFPTNVFQWSTILEVMAGFLNLEVGELMFFSDSLHVYEEAYNGDINKRMIIEERKYDVYDNFTPEQDKISFEKFEIYLDKIFEAEQKFRKGIFDIKEPYFGDGLWFNMYEIIKIFSLRKYKGDNIALEEALKLRKDFRVAVFEYIYRNSKNKINLIPSMYFSIEDMKYIRNEGGKENGIEL